MKYPLNENRTMQYFLTAMFGLLLLYGVWRGVVRAKEYRESQLNTQINKP